MQYASFGFYLLKCITLQFSTLSLIPHVLHQSPTANRSFCYLMISIFLFMDEIIFESSTNSFVTLTILSGKSFFCLTKRSIPKTSVHLDFDDSQNLASLQSKSRRQSKSSQPLQWFFRCFLQRRKSSNHFAISL